MMKALIEKPKIIFFLSDIPLHAMFLINKTGGASAPRYRQLFYLRCRPIGLEVLSMPFYISPAW